MIREVHVRNIGWVECEVTGRYRSATMDSPAEDPMIDILTITPDDLSILDDLTTVQLLEATADALHDERWERER